MLPVAPTFIPVDETRSGARAEWKKETPLGDYDLGWGSAVAVAEVEITNVTVAGARRSDPAADQALVVGRFLKTGRGSAQWRENECSLRAPSGNQQRRGKPAPVRFSPRYMCAKLIE